VSNLREANIDRLSAVLESIGTDRVPIFDRPVSGRETPPEPVCVSLRPSPTSVITDRVPVSYRKISR
jgi:hypothetical protein